MEQLKLKTAKTNIIFFIVCNIFIIGCKKNRIENVIIPQNYEGNVAIIYSNYQSVQNDVENYIIPQDGVLETDYMYREGNVKITFLQHVSINNYDTLIEEFPGMTFNNTKNRILFNRILSFRQGDEKERYVMTFYVGKKNAPESGKDRFLFERQLENKIFNK